MSSRLAELQRERVRLLQRIAIQRADLAEHFEPLREAAESGERAASVASGVIGYLKARPLQIAAVLTVLAMLRPAMAGRLALRGVGLWRTWRVIRNLRALLPATGLASVLKRFF